MTFLAMWLFRYTEDSVTRGSVLAGGYCMIGVHLYLKRIEHDGVLRMSVYSGKDLLAK